MHALSIYPYYFVLRAQLLLSAANLDKCSSFSIKNMLCMSKGKIISKELQLITVLATEHAKVQCNDTPFEPQQAGWFRKVWVCRSQVRRGGLPVRKPFHMNTVIMWVECRFHPDMT